MSAKFKASFPYTEFSVKKTGSASSIKQISVFRPIIPVTILYRQKFVQFAALADSGADYNIFHGDIATYLGIKLTSGSKKKISGISGQITGYCHKVSLKIDSYVWETNIIFSNQIPENAIAVLGNQGFFDKFNVEFNYRDKVISLIR